MEYWPLIAILILKYGFKAEISNLDYGIVIAIALTADASALIVKHYHGKDGK